jgi:hypothetical protein
MDPARLLAAAALLSGLLCAAGVAAAADSPSSKTGRIYIWTDKDGVRHSGDTVPPEYSQQQKSVLNAQGVELHRDEAPKSPEERAAEGRLQQEKTQRQQHDRFLLTTYTSTRDIERLRDERLAQIDAQIRATNGYIETIDSRLNSLAARALQFKPYSDRPTARRMPDDLAEQLVLGRTEVRSQRSASDKQKRDMLSVRAQFDADIARYRELTAPPAG